MHAQIAHCHVRQKLKKTRQFSSVAQGFRKAMKKFLKPPMCANAYPCYV